MSKTIPKKTSTVTGSSPSAGAGDKKKSAWVAKPPSDIINGQTFHDFILFSKGENGHILILTAIQGSCFEQFLFGENRFIIAYFEGNPEKFLRSPASIFTFVFAGIPMENEHETVHLGIQKFEIEGRPVWVAIACISTAVSVRHNRKGFVPKAEKKVGEATLAFGNRSKYNFKDGSIIPSASDVFELCHSHANFDELKIVPTEILETSDFKKFQEKVMNGASLTASSAAKGVSKINTRALPKAQPKAQPNALPKALPKALPDSDDASIRARLAAMDKERQELLSSLSKSKTLSASKQKDPLSSKET
jgi:hypothetical protein